MSQTNTNLHPDRYLLRIGLGLTGWALFMIFLMWLVLTRTDDWTNIFWVQLLNIFGVPFIGTLCDDHERLAREMAIEEQRKYLESPYHNLTEEERQQLANNNE